MSPAPGRAGLGQAGVAAWRLPIRKPQQRPFPGVQPGLYEPHLCSVLIKDHEEQPPAPGPRPQAQPPGVLHSPLPHLEHGSPAQLLHQQPRWRNALGWFARVCAKQDVCSCPPDIQVLERSPACPGSSWQSRACLFSQCLPHTEGLSHVGLPATCSAARAHWRMSWEPGMLTCSTCDPAAGSGMESPESAGMGQGCSPAARTASLT